MNNRRGTSRSEVSLSDLITNGVGQGGERGEIVEKWRNLVSVRSLHAGLPSLSRSARGHVRVIRVGWSLLGTARQHHHSLGARRGIGCVWLFLSPSPSTPRSDTFLCRVPSEFELSVHFHSLVRHAEKLQRSPDHPLPQLPLDLLLLHALCLGSNESMTGSSPGPGWHAVD